MQTRRTFLTSSLTLPLAAGLATPFLSRAGHAGSDVIKLRTLYDRQEISTLAQDLNDTRIAVDGYMAPPLKADSNFFVLTRTPMSVCPFCETEAEWPGDIVAVYTKRVVDVRPYNVKIVTSGRLELGGYRDPDTGFVSMMRLMDSSVA